MSDENIYTFLFTVDYKKKNNDGYHHYITNDYYYYYLIGMYMFKQLMIYIILDTKEHRFVCRKAYII